MSYKETLDTLRQSGNFRSIPTGDTPAGVTDYSLNDYLGLAARRDLTEKFFADESNRHIAMTSSAARLLAADQQEHHHLEATLNELYDGRDCLIFNSGYHANTGLISSLAAEKGTLIVADKLVHASIIDGITLSRAPFQRFVHNDFNRLEQILSKEHRNYNRILVIAEAVYSMDGDRTDLDALTDLKRRYPNTILYIDEAHSFGVIGPQGAGLSQAHERKEEVDIIVGTFGKACASVGAFAALSHDLRDYAINRARSFIFSTALPPINSAWTRFMIDHIRSMDSERRHLHELAKRLASRLGLTEARYITPVIIGSADGALEASRRLLAEGHKVLPIRTPTVPAGTERLRISLSAAMNTQQIDRLADSIKALLR